MPLRPAALRRLIAGLALLGVAVAALLLMRPGAPPRGTAADPVPNVLGVRGDPTLDMAEDLGGLDANHNGVRDDIERIIERAPLSERHRAGAMRLAQALQGVMTEPPLDRESARRRGKQTLDAAVCLASMGAPLRGLGDELEAYTFNTPARRTVALEARGRLDPRGLYEKGEWHCLGTG